VADGATTRTRTRRSRALLPLDALRGFLIGTAELVPGVSGGTVALVTGLYDHLIGSASHIVTALARLVTGPDRVRSATTELRRTDWWLVVPVLVGMATAVLTMAGLMSAFVTDHPEQARGLFLGLVAASIAVPLGKLPPPTRSRGADALVVVVAAAVAWFLIGLAGGGTVTDPPLLVVFLAASVAVCALVVPGVSGSFFLLAIGLYATTLDAVHDRDLGYMAVFAAGAVAGLGSFVQLLHWLLSHHRRTTLLAMAGLMAGSLRALWPWQDSPGEHGGPGALLAPTDPLWGPIGLALLGAATVTVMVLVEGRHSSSGTR
jgi:putative membrane protein